MKNKPIIIDLKNISVSFDDHKILDNIIRMFLHPALLIILLCAVILKDVSPILWIGIVLLSASPKLRTKKIKSNIPYQEDYEEKIEYQYIDRLL